MCIYVCVYGKYVYTYGIYMYIFSLFAGSVLYLCWVLLNLLMVFVYICIFHYFHYYLHDYITTICLEFNFGFSFLGTVLISLSAIKKHLWNLHS